MVFAEAAAGLVGDENSSRLTHAAMPADVAKQLDLSTVHHTVVVLHAPAMVEAWSEELEKLHKATNFVISAADEPPLAALVDRAQLNFHLKPDCPAVHVADDGFAVGIRWTEGFSKRVASQLLLVREQSTQRPRNAAP